MPRTRIKFCGMMHADDAALAAAVGADAVGLSFHPPARRNISLERARQIVAILPPFVTPVALFVNDTTERILDIATELCLRQVQLHGQETPEQVAALAPLRIIKAVRVAPATLRAELHAWRDAISQLPLSNLHGLVLESNVPAGGSGVENDWAAIRRHIDAGDFAGLPPIIAAGGLTPANVAGVVRALRPFAVDVSSGIEADFGRKSPDLMRAFVDAVRNADVAP